MLKRSRSSTPGIRADLRHCDDSQRQRYGSAAETIAAVSATFATGQPLSACFQDLGQDPRRRHR